MIETAATVLNKPESNAFSITAEECRKLEEEYEINDILVYLSKARGLVDGNTTINDAYELLKNRTRFADEVERYITSQSNTATAALTALSQLTK